MRSATGLTQRSHAYRYGPTRDADHYLYRCYDADGVLLYIGCTVNVSKRLAAHRRGKGANATRWLAVAMTTVATEGPFRGREAGRAAERAAIRAEQPLFNHQERANEYHAAWMTRAAVVDYLLGHGHHDLAIETTCNCGANDDPEWICYAHTVLELARTG